MALGTILLIVAWACAAALAAGGLFLAYGACFGRGGGRGPRCRACDYPVADAAEAGSAPGTSPEAGRCAECGADLSGRGITTGRVRPRGLVAAAVLLALAAACAFVRPSLEWRLERAPAWWLLSVERPLAEVRPRDGRRIEATLLDRRLRGALSDQVLERLMDEARATIAQGGGFPAATADIGAWADLAYLAFQDGVLTAEAYTPLFEQSVASSLRVEARPPRDVHLRFRTRGTGTGTRGAADPASAKKSIHPIDFMVRLSDVRVDGVPLAGPPGGLSMRRGGALRSSATWSSAQSMDLPVAPGTGVRPCTYELEFTVGDRSWTVQRETSFVMPAWPPEAFASANGPALADLIGPAPTLAFTSGVPDDPARGGTVTMEGALRAAIEDAHGRWRGADFGTGIVSADTSSVRTSRPPAPIRVLATWSVDAAPAERADVPVPFSRVLIRVPRSDLEPPPIPGEPDVTRGWIDVPPGTVWPDVPISRGE